MYILYKCFNVLITYLSVAYFLGFFKGGGAYKDFNRHTQYTQ